MSLDVDAIRASVRLAQSVAGQVQRHDGINGPAPPVQPSEPARAGPRAIEPSGGAERSGNASDQLLRERKLWAEDMRVRAERASTDPPEGELRPLPSFEYKVGPDGRVYATGDLDLPRVARDPPVSPRDVQRAYAMPTEETDANEVDTVT